MLHASMQTGESGLKPYKTTTTNIEIEVVKLLHGKGYFWNTHTQIYDVSTDKTQH